MRVEWLEEVDSTNSWLRREAPAVAGTLMVAAWRQTAGRGQRGNSWESEPGSNLTFSVLYHPLAIAPREQFMLSEAVALAVCDTLASFGISASVKWPNDIYAGDLKICGILIEHSLLGAAISHSVIGVGLNVNQLVFHGDAPNPVSMAALAGRPFPLEEVCARVADAMEARLAQLERRDFGALHSLYMSRLWRGVGEWPFVDCREKSRIRASIHGIAPDGTLTLRLADGSSRAYAFKEVTFPLD